MYFELTFNLSYIYILCSFVRTTCFQYYPIGREGNENEEKAWDACITAIDTKNRKLKTCDKENNKNAAK